MNKAAKRISTVIVFSLIICALLAPSAYAIGDPNQLISSGQGVIYDTNNHIYFLLTSDSSRCLNIYSDTPMNGSQLTSYTWSNNIYNGTQVWTPFNLTLSDGYVVNGYASRSDQSLAMNCYRLELNPVANIRPIVGNNAGDINIMPEGPNMGSMTLSVEPRTNNHPYQMYMYVETELPIGNGNYKIIWARGVKTNFAIHGTNN